MKRSGIDKIVKLIALLIVVVLALAAFTACSDGKDGKDGITPQIRINSETAEWEVSYDNGKTWTGLGYFAEAKKDTGFEGLKISILGDSISTYTNASNGTAATITNSTIKNGAI